MFSFDDSVFALPEAINIRKLANLDPLHSDFLAKMNIKHTKPKLFLTSDNNREFHRPLHWYGQEGN